MSSRKKKKNHGNSLDSPKDQHLYVIYDHEEREVLKYGISDKPIDQNGKCQRMREQLADAVLFSNTLLRYAARILIWVIPGRRKGRAIEDDTIDKWRAKNDGAFPRGNKDHQYLSKKERAKLKD